jgi:hypothetical protein
MCVPGITPSKLTLTAIVSQLWIFIALSARRPSDVVQERVAVKPLRAGGGS